MYYARGVQTQKLLPSAACACPDQAIFKSFSTHFAKYFLSTSFEHIDVNTETKIWQFFQKLSLSIIAVIVWLIFKVAVNYFQAIMMIIFNYQLICSAVVIKE